MGRRTPERKEKLQAKYDLKPISIDYLKMAREKSAKYILFANKNNKHGLCECCMKDVEFNKTKHKETVTCPNCGAKLTAQHTWRKRCEWNVNWYVIGECLDSETLALRYIRVSQNENYIKETEEKAREIFDFKRGWTYQFSLLEDGWNIDSRYYFTEFSMNYHRRKNCCIDAMAINNIREEMVGLLVIKYFNTYRNYYGIYTYARDNVKCLMNASLYEKMEKVGLGKMAMDDYKNYWHPIKYKRSEKSLVKMLRLDKSQYKLLLKYGTLKHYEFLCRHKEMSPLLADYVMSTGMVDAYDTIKSIAGDKVMKTLKYIVNTKVNTWEYRHYIDTLKRLGYSLDNAYRFPKDFRKADDRVTAEWNAKLDEEKLRGMTKQSAIIKQISDGLRSMDGLREFMSGSNGLLVYVPESAKDLVYEGRALHCCLGTYVDRIAEGKTLVFYVRKLNTPTEPFVAFEYYNGEVVQCRYDYNAPVKDDNIISFVDAFASKLRENKVLMAA